MTNSVEKIGFYSVPAFWANAYGDVIDRSFSREEKLLLVTEAKKGSQIAINKLIGTYTRFMLSLAKTYMIDEDDIEDVLSEGAAGIVKAVEMYDLERSDEACIGTYAPWWIRHMINSFALQRGQLKIPSRTAKLRVKVLSTINKLSIEGLPLTDKVETIAKELDLEGGDVLNVLMLDDDSVSLDSERTGADGMAEGLYSNYVGGEDESDVIIDQITVKNLLSDIKNDLKGEDREIINRFFGLSGANEEAVTTIAKDMNTTGYYVKKSIVNTLTTIKSKLMREGVCEDIISDIKNFAH